MACFGWRQEIEDDEMNEIWLKNTRRFSYASLQTATNNFSEERFIGKGGYGRVYRGVLPDKTLIAVKKYIEAEEQPRRLDFPHAVLEVIQGIRHQNINRVFGYSINKNEVLLVSEYVDNGTLLDLIRNVEKRESVFKWHLRVAVCTGIARGLSYLHQDANPHVIHRDIKPANILLGPNFTPKITDFDIARLFRNSDELAIKADEYKYIATLPLETAVQGTSGYVDPKYMSTGELTEKSGVYGFGVVMFEIVSGRMIISCRMDVILISVISNQLMNGLQNLWKTARRALEIIDPVLSDFPTDDVLRFIDVAFLCIQEDPKLRPSMNEVIQMLDEPYYSRRFLRTLTTHFSPVSSFRSSTHFEVEGESSVMEGEHNVNSTEIESAAQEENNGSTYMVEPSVIVLSGTGDLVERFSQTMVFKKHPRMDFPEAVYPPFRTRMFNGSRSLYTF